MHLSTNNCEVSYPVFPSYINQSFVTSTLQFLQKVKQFLNAVYIIVFLEIHKHGKYHMLHIQ